MQWIKVANTGDIDIDESLGLEIEGHPIALHRTDSGLYATDNICTHQYALLSEGYLEDDCIECPLHQAMFCLKTGKALNAPATVDIKTYPVKEENDEIFVSL